MNEMKRLFHNTPLAARQPHAARDASQCGLASEDRRIQMMQGAALWRGCSGGGNRVLRRVVVFMLGGIGYLTELAGTEGGDMEGREALWVAAIVRGVKGGLSGESRSGCSRAHCNHFRPLLLVLGDSLLTQRNTGI